MTFDDFIKFVNDTYYEHSFEWRYGQTIMNALHGVDPKKYNEIISTIYDCYYDDGTVKYTLEKLEKEWNNVKL